MPHSEREYDSPRILFLDAYDSFSNNIIALIQLEIKADVTVVKIDDPKHLETNEEEFEQFLSNFDAVVAGPGPGNPTNSKDVGLISRLWYLPHEHELPVLGICLGFQSLAYAFGACIERLIEPRHGIVQKIEHSNSSIFKEVGEVLVTQYHSLRAILGHSIESLTSTSNDEIWTASETCPDLIPLSWSLHDPKNGPTLMGVRHRSKPLWGVQFHPESICTNDAGSKLISVWWHEARSWTRGHRRHPRYTTRSWSAPTSQGQSSIVTQPEHVTRVEYSGKRVLWKEATIGNLDVRTVCEALCVDKDKILLLESGTTSKGRLVNSETGRFSIIGCINEARVEDFQYFSASQRLLIQTTIDGVTTREEHTIPDIWKHLAQLMKSRRVAEGPHCTPFWGGLVGYISYEAGLETIGLSVTDPKQRPDIWFKYIERSIVVDHVSRRIYVQSLDDADEPWVTTTIEQLQRLQYIPEPQDSIPTPPTHHVADQILYNGPSNADYCRKVRECQSHIRNGNSYELCLTAQTRILLPSLTANIPSWHLYTRLRKRNPAPFSAYLRFRDQSSEPGVTILSSSPERFLSWSRSGSCQFRPIKGTVSKSIAGMTREKAEEILQSSKERAENLMIVDLVRHDLHGVVGAGNLHVKKLMGVEEYETVYQLVSVIEGQVPCASPHHSRISDDDDKSSRDISGIDVLAASLPPGSMTGAPKRRSCELLREIEDFEPRGIYSGVLGYLDVGGGGDFSVVIRTAYRWDDDVDPETGHQIWRMGAGGAVTSQSIDEAEYEEMCIKREALLRAFEE